MTCAIWAASSRRSGQMKRKLPDLYETLQFFYRQDPAAWPRRARE